MTLRSFLLLLLTVSAIPVYAQLPADYFQQQVNTRIDVTLDDQAHFLHGREEISYTNNSDSTLTFLYIHLWPNAYQDDRTPFARQQMVLRKKDFFYAKTEDRGYIDSLSFTVDGQPAGFSTLEDAPDIARLDLPAAVKPGATIKIETPFRVKVPLVFSRMGHTGQSYCISQWFPKPAVFDRRGWHPISYLDQGEFYSEIGSYDVSITVPKNYVVMATGNCTDESELNWLKSKSRDSFVKDKKSVTPASDAETKTLHYHEDNVHDFAWFADKRFQVRMDTTIVKGQAEPVVLYAAFLPGSKSWLKATDYLKTTLHEYGKVGPYQYHTIKAVEGDMKAGGGMEYPTVTVIDRGMGEGLDVVVVHEAGHNWFYGMLASNERDHAWMDEGVNTFYEHRTMKALAASDSVTKGGGGIVISTDGDIVYNQVAASHTDQRLDQTSANFSWLNYDADVYIKTSLLLKWLEDYMGKDDFDAAMMAYFKTWHFHHPYPEDMQAIFQDHTTKDVSWFFRDALSTDQPIDFSLRNSQHQNESCYRVRAQNQPPLAPVVHVFKDGHDVQTISGRRATNDTVICTGGPGFRAAISTAIPDINLKNNGHGYGGLRMGVGLGFGPQKHEKIFLLPALGYNYYDGFMAGLLIHNISIPEHRFRYALAPMYGFGSGTFAGCGSIEYSFYPRGIFHEIILRADAKKFSYDFTDINTSERLYAGYTKVAPSLNFIFRKNDANSPVERSLLIRGYYIQEGYFDFIQDPDDSLFKPSNATQNKVYGLLRYQHYNNRLFNPFSYTADLELGEDFAKISVSGKLKIDYNKKNKAFYVRAYAGKFITLNDAPFATDRYLINAASTGQYDYLYDDLYFGRNERDGFTSHQISMREGGLKLSTPLYISPLGRSDNWLASLNIKTDLPLGKLPVRLFMDLATFSNAEQLNPSGSKVLFDGGLEISLLYDLININIPLIMSNDYRDYFKSIYGKASISRTYSFSINLNGFDWLLSQRKGLDFAVSQ